MAARFKKKFGHFFYYAVTWTWIHLKEFYSLYHTSQWTQWSCLNFHLGNLKYQDFIFLCTGLGNQPLEKPSLVLQLCVFFSHAGLLFFFFYSQFVTPTKHLGAAFFYSQFVTVTNMSWTTFVLRLVLLPKCWRQWCCLHCCSVRSFVNQSNNVESIS